MSNKGKHTIEVILQHINSSDRALERALCAIHDSSTVIQYNRLFDHWIIRTGYQMGFGLELTTTDKVYARQKLAQVKYYGILRRCADQIMGEG